MSKLLGIMGGTFNPIHNGHIKIARIAQRELGLDEVRFIPTGDSPHKTDVGVSGEQRLAMVRLAVEGCAGFTASDMEIKRGGRSYTFETLRALRMIERDTRLVFILGGDMLRDITSWRNPDVIVALADLAAVPRPGDDQQRIDQVVKYLRGEYGARLHLLSEFGPDISSTEIRRRVGAGERIDDLVPAAVEQYIRENGLYADRGVTPHDVG